MGSTVSAIPALSRGPVPRLPTCETCGRAVHRSADAVAAELGHDTHAFALRQFLNCRADVTEPGPVTNDRDPGVPATPRDLDEAPRLLARFADDEHRARVAVITVELRRHVDVDDVTWFQPFVVARDAVANHVVTARADRRRKTVVPELTGPTSTPSGVFANEAIDVGRRHAGAELGPDERERSRRGATSPPHSLDLGSAQDLDHRSFLHAAGERSTSNTLSIWRRLLRSHAARPMLRP